MVLKACLWLGPVLSGPAWLLETFYGEASPVINLLQTCCKVQKGPAEGQSPKPVKRKATRLYRDGLPCDKPEDPLQLLGWVWGGMGDQEAWLGMLWRGGTGAWWNARPNGSLPAPRRDLCTEPGSCPLLAHSSALSGNSGLWSSSQNPPG